MKTLLLAIIFGLGLFSTGCYEGLEDEGYRYHVCCGYGIMYHGVWYPHPNPAYQRGGYWRGQVYGRGYYGGTEYGRRGYISRGGRR